jgi:hypothetical protein
MNALIENPSNRNLLRLEFYSSIPFGLTALSKLNAPPFRFPTSPVLKRHELTRAAKRRNANSALAAKGCLQDAQKQPEGRA